MFETAERSSRDQEKSLYESFFPLNVNGVLGVMVVLSLDVNLSTAFIHCSVLCLNFASLCPHYLLDY